jgi:hypothetical protein
MHLDQPCMYYLTNAVCIPTHDLKQPPANERSNQHVLVDSRSVHKHQTIGIVMEKMGVNSQPPIALRLSAKAVIFLLAIGAPSVLPPTELFLVLIAVWFSFQFLCKIYMCYELRIHSCDYVSQQMAGGKFGRAWLLAFVKSIADHVNLYERIRSQTDFAAQDLVLSEKFSGIRAITKTFRFKLSDANKCIIVSHLVVILLFRTHCN